MTWQRLFDRRKTALRSKDAIDQALVSVQNRFGLKAVYISRSSEGDILLRSAAGKTQFLPGGSAFKDAHAICHAVLSGRPLAPSKPHLQLVPQPQKSPTENAHISIPVCLKDGSVHGLFCAETIGDRKKVKWQKASIRALCDVLAYQVQIECDEAGGVARLSDRIREIIEEDQLRIVFQPIIGCRSGEILGFEVLSRFPDDDRRSTADWFAEAKAVGLGGALELQAIRLALQKMPLFPEGVYIALNASPELLLKEEIYTELNEAPRHRIVVEVTEHDIVHDYKSLKKALGRIRPNVRVAVDDTGAGYSSFRHILDLKPEIIKLDASLVSAIDQDKGRLALGGAIVSFAHGLNMRVVAEGVETQAELEALKSLGIDAAQGFYFSKPLGASDAIKEARNGFALSA